MSVAELQQIKESWKSIMKRRLSETAQLESAKSVV